jgi:ribosomal protein S18 acetylase RimI-like enzyme
VTNGAGPRALSQAGFLAGLDALVAVYGLAMRPPPQQLPGRRSIMAQHAGYSAFRAVAVAADRADARPANTASGDASGPDSPVIAFAYGFRGADGQWWYDVVRSGITAAAGAKAAAAWLADTFEIAEVHVRPEYQRRGIGRAMLLSLSAGCPHRTAVLSTLDAPSPARRLYRSLGFTDLLTGFSFPGNGPPYVIMGAALPLRDNEPGLPRPSR